MRFIVGITGASGAIYAQRLIDQLASANHTVHLITTEISKDVITTELPGGLSLPPGVVQHPIDSMDAPFASGSSRFDGMVIIPCTMGTLGRIAHGLSNNLMLRAADVMLKEHRKLILVPRETPLNLVHVRNMELLILAGATIIPANPSFYSAPKTVAEVADTVVARVLDHLSVAHNLATRWQEERE